MGKYDPLETFLKSIKTPHWRASFADIEKILGFKLPRSARKHPAWWSNDDTGHSHARAWLEAGCRTQDVDVSAEKVSLVRSVAQASAPKSDPWGCMAGTVRIAPGVDLTAPAGEAWNADAGKLFNE